ncbi:NAD(P)-binding protein [Aaosphaeria arxii CBS 175.79]|uniref:NAD(P)-binding protein n=1 Tax=Aaosphaeria arxii CBS 175.79 TaxID=1450172 RepID=A0A6A5Y312_9PLEO|nr:NAD(P)-binding protein [Aaosphaeria arxii CBS 175.79]KAF2019626.1 NAD(P)-binding protein [Aaosphaeria arxii CBS 175.79]
MAQYSILITGAAGYIGGSILSALVSLEDQHNIFATVRTFKQADAVVYQHPGITVLQVDVTHEKEIEHIISTHEIDIVIQAASSIDSRLSIQLISALSKRKQRNGGKNVWFIHTSGLGGFCVQNGWPVEEREDTGPIFETEKRLMETFPIRKTDVEITEYAEVMGVDSLIVVLPIIYGKGTGAWNQLSINLPIYVKSIIQSGRARKFAENTKVSASHISDLVSLYTLLVSKIIAREDIPRGKEGYYFALAHRIEGWEVAESLSGAAKARGLIADSTVEVWESDASAAEAMGVPEMFVQVLWNSGDEMIARRPFSLGWSPKWDRKRFIDNIDDEIAAVLELGEAKSSLVSSLFKFAGV